MDLITAMANVYVDMINNKTITIEQVPSAYLAAVKAKMGVKS